MRRALGGPSAAPPPRGPTRPDGSGRFLPQAMGTEARWTWTDPKPSAQGERPDHPARTARHPGISDTTARPPWQTPARSATWPRTPLGFLPRGEAVDGALNPEDLARQPTMNPTTRISGRWLDPSSPEGKASLAAWDWGRMCPKSQLPLYGIFPAKPNADDSRPGRPEGDASPASGTDPVECGTGGITDAVRCHQQVVSPLETR